MITPWSRFAPVFQRFRNIFRITWVYNLLIWECQSIQNGFSLLEARWYIIDAFFLWWGRVYPLLCFLTTFWEVVEQAIRDCCGKSTFWGRIIELFSRMRTFGRDCAMDTTFTDRYFRRYRHIIYLLKLPWVRQRAVFGKQLQVLLTFGRNRNIIIVVFGWCGWYSINL